MKRLFILTILMIAILWGCCSVEDTPKTEEKEKITSYKVTFDSNGGSGIMPEQLFVVGTPQSLNPNTFKRTGYVFTEWNTEADGKGVTYMSGSYYSLTSDITLYAQWEAKEEDKKEDDAPVKTYTVTFTSTYGTAPNKIIGLKENDKLTSSQLPKLTTDGYTFGGWYNGETKIEAGYKITGNLKLTAKWTANSYTVKFNANGGSGEMKDQTFTYDIEQTLTANTFTRDGYTFSGWAVSADENAVYADMGKVKKLTVENNATITLYAVWTENNKVLPVIFSLPSETAVDCGDSVTLSCGTDGAKISYTIDGVTQEYIGEIVITEDVTITAFATKDGMKNSNVSTATYTVKTYSVTFASEYGVTPSEIGGLKKGDKLTSSQLPKLTTAGYTFVGWYNGETKIEAGYKITGNLKLTAKWTLKTYTVTFDANGGSGEMKDQTFTYDIEQTLTANTFTRDGYTFAGWALSADSNAVYIDMGKVKNLTSENNATVTLYAKWLKLYTITYELNGGINAESNPVNYTVETETVTLVNATRECYTFAGWYIDEECSDGITEIIKGSTGDITLYAKWIANNYTVTFDSNGGTGKMPSQVFTFGTLQPLNSNTFKYTGCTFKEWNTKADGSGKTYSSGESCTFGEDTTLYAQWIANKVGITVILPPTNDAEINLQQSTNENTVTFTANEGFDSYVWYIDGVKQSGTSTTYAIDTLTLEPANYKVMVIVADGDEYYSATADLEVKRVQ